MHVACSEMLDKLSPDQLLGLMDGFYDSHSIITVGTACSGTDILLQVLNTLGGLFKKYGFAAQFVHKYSCDSKSASEAFITRNAPPEVLLQGDWGS